MDRDFDMGATYSDGVFRPDEPVALPEGVHGHFPFGQDPLVSSPESRRRAWELIDRIRAEKLVRLNGQTWSREDLYDRG